MAACMMRARKLGGAAVCARGGRTLNMGSSHEGKSERRMFTVASWVWRGLPYLAFSLRVRSMMPSYLHQH